jgi:hypothetical protein
MLRRMLLVVASAAMLAGLASTAQAAEPMPRFFYYPYYYFPHSYWPSNSPQWPEPPGMPYQRPPAYMSYPPFLEPRWHYMLFESHRYYSGHHFWLDQF